MIEHIPLMWALAFFIDVILGCLSFYMVFVGLVTKKYESICWWMGWWSFADAITLILNVTMGIHYFWSYHQMGIVTDTAINLGLIVYVGLRIHENYAMKQEDWDKINEIRKESKIRKLEE